MHKTLSNFLSFFFPPSQAEKRISHHTIHTFCAHMPPTLIKLGPLLFALCPYHDKEMSNAIWALKYHRSTHATKLLATTLYPKLQELLPMKPITIVPMPRSPRRIRKYGYNQMELLGEALVALDTTNHFSLVTDVLKRKDVAHQTSLTRRHSRLINVHNTFFLKDAEMLHDNTVVILDDVITTGATMHEARKTLEKAGIHSIICVGVAHQTITASQFLASHQ